MQLCFYPEYSRRGAVLYRALQKTADGRVVNAVLFQRKGARNRSPWHGHVDVADSEGRAIGAHRVSGWLPSRQAVVDELEAATRKILDIEAAP